MHKQNNFISNNESQINQQPINCQILRHQFVSHSTQQIAPLSHPLIIRCRCTVASSAQVDGHINAQVSIVSEKLSDICVKHETFARVDC